MFNGEHPCQPGTKNSEMVGQIIQCLKQNKQRMSSGFYKLLESMLQPQLETRISARQAMGNQLLIQPQVTADESIIISKQIVAFSKVNQLQKLIFAFLAHWYIKQDIKQKFQFLFQQVDNDGDGIITKQDIKQMFKNVYISTSPSRRLQKAKNEENNEQNRKKNNIQLDLTRPVSYSDVGKIFPNITYRQVGFLEFYEFLTIMQFSQLGSQELETYLQFIFNSFDIDNKNYLTYSDFLRIFNNKKNDPQEIQALFMIFDQSSANCVTFKQFKEKIIPNQGFT